MRKKLLLVTVCVYVLFSIFITPINAENKEGTKLTKEKIIQLFPEYKERIIEVFANIENSNVKSDEITREFDISAEKRIIENNNESTYQIVFFKDNMSMLLLNYVSPSLSVGSENSNSTTYSCSNSMLSLNDYCIGANKYISVINIGFTINKNNYDKLNSINTIASMTVEDNGSLSTETVNRNSYYSTETSSRRAGGHYIFTYTYLAFEVGQNQTRVLYDGDYYVLNTYF